MMIRKALTVMLVCLGAAAAEARPQPAVVFAKEEIKQCNAEMKDREALRQTIVSSWGGYLNQDAPAFLATLTADVTRMTRRVDRLQQGAEQVKADLPREWQAFERHKGLIAEEMTVREATIRVDRGESAQTAQVSYWVEIEGGGRWGYADQGLVSETLVRRDGKWRIAHHSESWSLNYDLDAHQPGQSTFEFDYVYPVRDLKRALSYYEPILGAPEVVSQDSASFNLGGPRFILQVNPLQGLAGVRQGLPSGYAVIGIDDVMATQARLRQAGVKFLLGTDQQPRVQGPDRYLVVADPSGNVLMLVQRNFGVSLQGPAPVVTGFDSKDPYAQAAARVARAWMATDAQALRPLLSPDCRWFDDQRTRVRGQEKGLESILGSLQKAYWPGYDRTLAGLQGQLAVSHLKVRPLGKGAVVSYEATLTGQGPHPFRQTSLVTQVFDDRARLVDLYSVAHDNPGKMVLELDYTGYPVTDLEKSDKFYSQVMRMGPSYKDTDYRGFWSNHAVFGIYQADPDEDGLPQPRKANGYVSFWVLSAQKAYSYAQKHGGTFPVIEAINERSGVCAEPGYKQLYTTDSEGNGLIFSEYTGRP